jgi:hypothetical protein
MVALERIKEYNSLPREQPEVLEPRPPASWPSAGSITCSGLTIRYAVRSTSEFRAFAAVSLGHAHNAAPAG